eukprot:gene2368-2673_t
MGLKDTKMFENWARKAFNSIDVDKSGMVDYKEVCIGILYIYDNLNMKFPAHVPAPTRTEIMNLCKKYDTNENGAIDFNEFLEMAKVLVGSRTNFFDSLLWKYGSILVLKLVICPLAAAFLIKQLVNLHTPFAEKVPAAPIASILEMCIKMAAKSANTDV